MEWTIKNWLLIVTYPTGYKVVPTSKSNTSLGERSNGLYHSLSIKTFFFFFQSFLCSRLSPVIGPLNSRWLLFFQSFYLTICLQHSLRSIREKINGKPFLSIIISPSLRIRRANICLSNLEIVVYCRKSSVSLKSGTKIRGYNCNNNKEKRTTKQLPSKMNKQPLWRVIIVLLLGFRGPFLSRFLINNRLQRRTSSSYAHISRLYPAFNTTQVIF
jgi:hypothetical protein